MGPVGPVRPVPALPHLPAGAQGDAGGVGNGDAQSGRCPQGAHRFHLFLFFSFFALAPPYCACRALLLLHRCTGADRAAPLDGRCRPLCRTDRYAERRSKRRAERGNTEWRYGANTRSGETVWNGHLDRGAAQVTSVLGLACLVGRRRRRRRRERRRRQERWQRRRSLSARF